jgi:hypothetical protein
MIINPKDANKNEMMKKVKLVNINNININITEESSTIILKELIND